jgi:hypothetical protein
MYPNAYRRFDTMPYANLSVTVPVADMTLISTALETLRAKLPFLVMLTPEERKTILKLGDKSVAFMEKALDAARQHPEILPADFSLEEFEKDVKLVEQLTKIRTELVALLQGVDDTLMAAGSETMVHSVTVYSYCKTAARRSPGLRGTVEGMAERWKKLTGKEKPKTTTPPSP